MPEQKLLVQEVFYFKVDSQTQALIEGAKFKLEKAKVENGEITGFETVMNEEKRHKRPVRMEKLNSLV